MQRHYNIYELILILNLNCRDVCSSDKDPRAHLTNVSSENRCMASPPFCKSFSLKLHALSFCTELGTYRRRSLSHPTETVLSNKITRNGIVLSFKDSPSKPLRRRPVHPVWFIMDTSNFRLVCPLELSYMVHATSLI